MVEEADELNSYRISKLESYLQDWVSYVAKCLKEIDELRRWIGKVS